MSGRGPGVVRASRPPLVLHRSHESRGAGETPAPHRRHESRRAGKTPAPHPARGASLIELVVAMAVFAVFLLILTSLAGEYRRLDRELRFGWFVHPDDMAVATRLRRDVLDSRGYPESFGSDQQTPTTLLLERTAARTIVWRFGGSSVRREEWNGAVLIDTWAANATRRFEIGAWEAPDGAIGVRLQGKTDEGRTVVDRVYAPRPR